MTPTKSPPALNGFRHRYRLRPGYQRYRDGHALRLHISPALHPRIARAYTRQAGPARLAASRETYPEALTGSVAQPST